MNALLQALSVLTGFWSTLFLLWHQKSNIFHLLLRHTAKKCFFLNQKNPIDPSCFLDAFFHFMVSMERGDFVVNSQQDVPEVLNYLFDNFCGVSVLAQDQIKVVIRNRITCTNCLQSDDREDIHMILKLNVAGNIISAFNIFLNEEVKMKSWMSSLLVQTQCLSGKESGGSWKICYYSPKKGICWMMEAGWRIWVWWIVLVNSWLFLST